MSSITLTICASIVPKVGLLLSFFQDSWYIINVVLFEDLCINFPHRFYTLVNQTESCWVFVSASELLPQP